MKNSIASKSPRTGIATEGRLMRAVDTMDRAIDSRLPQSQDAIHRRRIAVRAIGGAMVVAVAVAGYGVIPKKVESEKVTVEQGDSISDVLQKAQVKAAADNPNISPIDTSYVSAAYALEHEQEVNGQAGHIKPGQEIEVDYAQNWYGKNAVSARVLPDNPK